MYTIMLIGRWSSDAFLRYIRKQVQEFSSGVSRKMILSTDFFTIPEEQAANIEDPRTATDPNKFRGRGLHQHGRTHAQSQAFALHH